MTLFHFVITATITALLLVYFLRSKLDQESYGRRKSMRNDKLVLVTNTDHAGIKMLLKQFCGMYTKSAFQVVLRLTETGEREFAISFPVDVEFEVFCYLVNYLQQPTLAITTTQVMGWATTKTGDPWITPLSANKKAMFFILPEETGKDYLFLTTEENTGYKLQLAAGGNEFLLDRAAKLYDPPPLSIETLIGKLSEDFR
jgi:hypothetical protein